MLDCAVNDEPSMETILAEVRRILLAEESARAAPPLEEENDAPLLLTQMLVADGSVVSIAPGTRACSALRPMINPRNPFAKIDALKNEVSALLGADSRLWRRSKSGAPMQCAEPARSEACSATVQAAALCQGPIIADGEQPASGRAVRLRARVPAPIMMGDGNVTVVADDAVPDAPVPRDPAAEIERMLAHQMATAHHAVITLASAAVEQIHGGDEGARAAAPRSRGGVRVLPDRRRSGEAARLADTAVRMMQAYNHALATLMTLGGEATKSMAARHVSELGERKTARAQPAPHAACPARATRGAAGRKRRTSKHERPSAPVL